ncbi:hypothetical protein [Spiroplasma melliferum]|uniref:PvuRts1 I-like SET and RING associated domain-containing protein n=2 Tax=Spiroplasma melliferum TaxID=2134 RepID=A0AAI9X0P2_SPIME|nr:hypothetical protein [Spiroplasma melliferum]ELL44445.1 hypothetical protein SMIPMB4A_v3c6940 [Spiroplasma melliferum IPMB4A]KAI92110.1 hypothetical protein SPM_005065 [Spiroplasma melliferum KC3]QCO23522.1 hypothetical protein SRED_001991 [Spiroplasma melliferum]
MPNETLQKILQQKEITTDDQIIFRTIFDVLSTLFTDENHLSTLTSGYNINHYQQVWFPNIVPLQQKELAIKKGYANYMSDDWTYIYYFNGTNNLIKQQKLGEKQLHHKTQLITFAKLNEKKFGIGYHFVGVFTFIGFLDQDCKTMIYQKIKNSYHFNK